MNEKISYWIELSDYDLDTAEALLASGRYLYVGFMSHQAIEKILKAYFVSVKNETAPFSHSLSHLAKRSGLFENFLEEQIDFPSQHPGGIYELHPQPKFLRQKSNSIYSGVHRTSSGR